MRKKFIKALAVMAVVLAGFTGLGFGETKASAGCLAPIGNYSWNVSMCTDAYRYTKNADTIDVSLSIRDGFSRHNWKMNLELQNPSTKKWSIAGFTKTGYVSPSSPSYRSFTVNDFTWFSSPNYRNGRIRIHFTSGEYSGRYMYTESFRIDDQG